MTFADLFDEEYFEDGIRSGKSLYENFRWMPQKSFPIAATIKELYPEKRILDYGCAKGFVVYALRLLGMDAFGYDISSYAINNCKPEVKQFIYSNKQDLPMIDVIFGKDILEHLPYEHVDSELKWLNSICKEACFIIPFGSNGRYRIAEYGFDVTHVIAEDEEWWIKRFYKAGFVVDHFYYRVRGFKDNWISHDPYGNGIFLLSNKI